MLGLALCSAAQARHPSIRQGFDTLAEGDRDLAEAALEPREFGATPINGPTGSTRWRATRHGHVDFAIIIVRRPVQMSPAASTNSPSMER